MPDTSSENEDISEGSADEQEAPIPTDDDGSDSEAGEEIQAAAEDDTDDEMTVCDDGTYDTDEESDAQKPDEDGDDDEELEDEVDDDKDVPTPTPKPKPKKEKKAKIVKAKTPKPSEAKIERITNTVRERYEKRKGLQLYVRFPHKLPEDMEGFQKLIKSLSDLVVEGHKPRQKHARFCLVDFATTEDRDIALKQLTKSFPQTKIVVSLPRTDSEDYIQTLITKKLKQDYQKRAKNLLRMESRKNVKEKTFTPIIRVMNIPKSASTAEIKALFPNAVDIQTKPASSKFDGKMVATVTLPSTSDARDNVKRNLELGGNKLIIRFNSKNRKRENKPKKKKPAGAADEDGEPKKGPIAPASPAKRSLSENGDAEVAPKKTKVEVNAKDGAKNGQEGGKKKKGKKPFPPNKGSPVPNKNQDGKPNKQNKQKKKKAKPLKAAASAAE